ncbi:MAG TPA: hypothetical protein PKA06_16880, partial [Gemmatales bacterium]|nr:hypothetical protein [Gemmatales bacterium]
HVVSERHFYKLFKNLIPWEVEKNLIRLASSWTTATEAAVLELRHQAIAWYDPRFPLYRTPWKIAPSQLKSTKSHYA